MPIIDRHHDSCHRKQLSDHHRAYAAGAEEGKITSYLTITVPRARKKKYKDKNDLIRVGNVGVGRVPKNTSLGDTCKLQPISGS